MSDNKQKKAKREDIYIYDIEGHYTWHGSFREALENMTELITRKE